jgi:hypothetical protein
MTGREADEFADQGGALIFASCPEVGNPPKERSIARFWRASEAALTFGQRSASLRWPLALDVVQ